MKSLLAGLFFFQLYSVGFAQKYDSLQTLIQQTKTDTAKAILYSFLADELTKTNPQKSVEVAKEGIKLSLQIGFDRGVFENYFSLASSFQGQAQFDSAIHYFHKARVVAIETDRRFRASKSLLSIGAFFYAQIYYGLSTILS
jgi:hypothetical protein